MKKSIKTILGILLMSALFTSSAIAQERTSLNIHKTIELKNDSENKEVNIEVTEKECRFNLQINSSVGAGEVRVEIYDPEGKKQGNFSVGCEVDSKNANETVNAMIAKLIENPALGKWKVKILPKNASGKVTIQFSQDVNIKEKND
jgi:phosphoribosylformylglycinamidine (FGAM) synthase PurS component